MEKMIKHTGQTSSSTTISRQEDDMVKQALNKLKDMMVKDSLKVELLIDRPIYNLKSDKALDFVEDGSKKESENIPQETLKIIDKKQKRLGKNCFVLYGAIKKNYS